MKHLIKNILKESDFDWALEIPGVPSWLRIVEPVSQKNPKNHWRIHFTNVYGRDGETWAGNWVGVDQYDIEGLKRYVTILKILENSEDSDIHELVGMYMGGIKSFLSNDHITHIDKNLEGVTDEDAIYDIIQEIIMEYLRDEGMIDWDERSDNYTSVTGVKVTYFDEHGVEYLTDIDYGKL